MNAWEGGLAEYAMRNLAESDPLRRKDYFAGLAMQALIQTVGVDYRSYEELARKSFEIAEAMVKASK